MSLSTLTVNVVAVPTKAPNGESDKTTGVAALMLIVLLVVELEAPELSKQVQ